MEILLVVLWILSIYFIGKEKGDYDFISPMLGMFLFVLGIVVIVCRLKFW